MLITLPKTVFHGICTGGDHKAQTADARRRANHPACHLCFTWPPTLAPADSGQTLFRDIPYTALF